MNVFPNYNSIFPQIPVTNGVYYAPNGFAPQWALYPNPGYNPYMYANIPGNQWALPNPVGPVANNRNIPHPSVQQFIQAAYPYPQTYPNLRQPIQSNPMMNVPVTGYDAPQPFKDYDRYESTAYPTPKTEAVEKEVKSDFVDGLFQDPAGKLFERNNSQRQFYSVPVGSVPSEQTEFAQWLYGKGDIGTCKEGSTAMRYGVKFTPQSLLCTGFDSSTPTNFGRLNTE